MTTHYHHDNSRWVAVARQTLFASLLVVGLLVGSGWGQVTFPPQPPSGSFVVDEATLLTPAHRQEIEGLAGALKREHGYPVSVVTIRSLSAHGASALTIERYTSEMLKAWNLDADRQGYDAMGRGLRLPGESHLGWLMPAAQPWWLIPAI